MNYWFINWWTAVSTAQITASEYISNITDIINPVKTTNVALNNILAAFSVGLSFIPGPESVIGSAILTGAQQIPDVAAALYPVGTVDSEQQQISQISVNLATTAKTLQGNIASALPAIMNDTNAFAAFASTGAFSQILPNVNDIADQLLNGLMAYVISQAYQANGVFITRQLNTSVVALTTNGTALTYQLPCTTGKSNSSRSAPRRVQGKPILIFYTGYDANGVCDTFWYDSSDDTTYALTQGNSEDRTTGYNKDMVKWFNGYTRPELLFRGAAKCANAAGASQGTGPPVSISSSGFSTDCLSNMKVCTWSLTAGKDWDPLFTDCTDGEAFQGLDGPRVNPTPDDTSYCKGGGGNTPSFRAFRQYLGWGILQDNTKFWPTKFCAGNAKT
jgi:hypothetical protein